MHVYALSLLGSYALTLISIRAFCLLLDLRSRALFVGVYSACFFLAFYLNYIVRPTIGVASLTLPLNAFVNIVLPLALSRGRFVSRVLRTSAIMAVMMLTEIFGGCVYLLTSGSAMIFPEAIDMGNIGHVLVIYALLCLISAPLFEIVIMLFGKDEEDEPVVTLAPTLLMVESSLLFATLLRRLDTQGGLSPLAMVLPLLYTASTLATTMLLIAVARHDAHTARMLATQAATERQDERVRQEVQNAARRTLELRRLRHDLANQMDVVGELAAAGRVDEADRYLAALQERAQRVTGEAS